MNSSPLKTLPGEVLNLVCEQLDYKSIPSLRSTCHELDQFINSPWFRAKPIVDDKTLYIYIKSGAAYGMVIPLDETPSYKFPSRPLNHYATFRFSSIHLGTVAPPEVMPFLKQSRYVGATLTISLPHLGEEVARDIVEALRPKRVIINFSRHSTAHPDAIKCFTTVPYVDVFTGNIMRLSGDLRRFIRNHDVVTLNVDMFSDWAFRHILKQWQYGRTFYDLKRLEVKGRGSAFRYCGRTFTSGLYETKYLGCNETSMTQAVLLPSRHGYCLVITDPLRMIFMPVRTRARAFAAILAEFAPKTPVDVSSILYDPDALNKIMKMTQDDDFDFFA